MIGEAAEGIALGGGLARIVRDEQATIAAGHATVCGNLCDGHSGLACVRAVHPHDPDADMGDGKPPGDVVPHAAFDGDGQLVQWTCLPGDHDSTDTDQSEADTAAEREEATRTLLAQIDPALLVALLREGGHL